MRKGESMLQTIDAVRRECIRIGGLVTPSDTAAIADLVKIQQQADSDQGPVTVPDLSLALQNFLVQYPKFKGV
jgi:hypothetical protein